MPLLHPSSHAEVVPLPYHALQCFMIGFSSYFVLLKNRFGARIFFIFFSIDLDLVLDLNAYSEDSTRYILHRILLISKW